MTIEWFAVLFGIPEHNVNLCAIMTILKNLYKLIAADFNLNFDAQVFI